jgi:integrase
LDLKQYPATDNVFLRKRGDIIINLELFSDEFKVLVKEFIEKYLFEQDLSYIAKKKQYLTPLLNLISYLNLHKIAVDNIELLKDSKFIKDYEDYIISLGLSTVNSEGHKTKNILITQKLYTFWTLSRSADNYFENDIWIIDELPIDPIRQNNSDRINSFDFSDIRNTKNKTSAKEYINYLITKTTKHVSTIKGELYSIKEFLIWMGDTEVADINIGIVNEYCDYIAEKNIKPVVFNRKVECLKRAFDYFVITKTISVNPLQFDKRIKFSPREYKLTSIDDYVISQIFERLPLMDEKLRLMFLIDYCTGLRIHSISSLKVDCIYKGIRTDTDGNKKTRYYLIDYSSKQEKISETPIPKILYELIKDRIEYIKAEDGKERYLFSSEKSKNRPYVADLYNRKINEFIIENNIKDVEGKIFHFSSHKLRHTLATDMVNMDIPFETIRKIMHHTSPEMTLYYAEIHSVKLIEQHKEFINNLGEKILFNEDVEVGNIAELDWLKKNINAQMLPNGICSLPTKMGTCESGNSCLECSKFRTSKDFLEVHKQQLESAKLLLAEAQKNAWETQIKTNEKIVEKLKKIISVIEED